jgi:hypothetical protein
MVPDKMFGIYIDKLMVYLQYHTANRVDISGTSCLLHILTVACFISSQLPVSYPYSCLLHILTVACFISSQLPASYPHSWLLHILTVACFISSHADVRNKETSSKFIFVILQILI